MSDSAAVDSVVFSSVLAKEGNVGTVPWALPGDTKLPRSPWEFSMGNHGPSPRTAEIGGRRIFSLVELVDFSSQHRPSCYSDLQLLSVMPSFVMFNVRSPLLRRGPTYNRQSTSFGLMGIVRLYSTDVENVVL